MKKDFLWASVLSLTLHGALFLVPLRASPEQMQQCVMVVSLTSLPRAVQTTVQRNGKDGEEAFEHVQEPEVIHASEPEPQPVASTAPVKHEEPKRFIPKRMPKKAVKIKKRTQQVTQHTTLKPKMQDARKTVEGGAAAQASSMRMPVETEKGQGPGIQTVGAVSVVKRVLPVYPRLSRVKGEEGEVLALLTVREGRVISVNLEQSSGFSALDQAALRALSQWRFEALLNARVRVPVRFSLRGVTTEP